MRKLLSVVIGTYNQRETLKLCLDSLSKQTLPAADFEIILVDSSSTDGTDEMVRALNRANLRYIRQENLGRPGARNRGIKEANADLIFFTDADIVSDERLLAEHVKCHETFPNVSVQGLEYELKRFENFTDPINLTPYIKARPKPLEKLPWSYFLTGNLSARKASLDKAGLFDPAFTGYGWEDIELGYRMSKMGVPLLYLPSAINYHFHLLSEKEKEARYHKMGLSAAKFYNKHRNLRIKYYLGLNPIAMGVFHLIRVIEPLKHLIKSRAEAGSRLFKYINNEYIYRQGIVEGLNK